MYTVLNNYETYQRHIIKYIFKLYLAKIKNALKNPKYVVNNSLLL